MFTIVRSADTCLPDDTSVTPGTTAFAFSNPAQTTVTLTIAALVITDIQTEIANKLAIAGGLRTTMGAALGMLEIDSSGNEVKRLITASASIISTDTLQSRDPSTRAIKETPMSYIETLINNISAKIVNYPAGEALAANDFVYLEKLSTFVANYLTNVPSVNFDIGNSAANTRGSVKGIGNGVSMTTLKIPLNKTGAPVDNVTVRIETDSGGNPSGTLVHANATASIAGGTITSGYSEVTVTFGGAFTIADGTPCHIVIARSGGIDAVNYYYTSLFNRNVRCFVANKYNASWGSPITTYTIGYICTGMHANVVCKTRAAFRETSVYLGYVAASVAIGASATITTEKKVSTFSGLTANSAYYLSDTAGLISLTPGTVTRMVGYSTNTTSIDILPAAYNTSLFDQYVAASLLTIYNTNGVVKQWTCLYPTTFVVTTTGTAMLSVDQTAKTSGVAFELLPGQTLLTYAATTLSVQILEKRPMTVLSQQ